MKGRVRVNHRFIALCIPLLMLTGCSQLFLIEVNDVGNSTRLSFFETGLFSKKPISPCLRNIEIFTRGNPDRRIAFIRPTTASCSTLHEVDLAVLPEGYEIISEDRGIISGRLFATALADDGRRGMSDEFSRVRLQPAGLDH